MSDEIDNGRREFLGQGAVAAGVALAAGALTTTVEAGEQASEASKATGKLEAAVCDVMTLSTDHLARLDAVTKRLGGQPLGWCAYGQPAIDTVCGTVDFPAAKLGDFTAELAKWRGRIPIGIHFPYGIPADLGRVLVSIRAGANRSDGR